MRSSKESFFPVMEVYEIFTVVIYLLTMRHPKTLWEDESFSVSEYQGSNSLLNVIKFTYNITKPKVEREVNEGLGRDPDCQGPRCIWGCPVWQNDISYSDKSIKSYKKLLLNTLHLHSAWQFSGSCPFHIGLAVSLITVPVQWGMETDAGPAL